jgi:hypothetical protein
VEETWRLDPAWEGIGVDDSTTRAVLDALGAEVAALLAWVAEAEEVDLANAERRVREGVLALGARLLEAGLAARGTGKAGPRLRCACGGTAAFEGYRPKTVQTLVGWLTVRRAYYHCPGCGAGQAPLDRRLGLARDGHSPGVRRLLGRFGALLPFAQAAATLGEAAGVETAASTARAVTEALGGRREREVEAAVAAAWRDGLPPAGGPAPARLYVAMDGVFVRATRGEGKEAKVVVVAPEHRGADGEARRAAAAYAASFAPADHFGRRLALEAHRRGAEAAAEVVVLGDGAEWIWNLAGEHFPAATQILDWYHASERVWDLGRARYGEGTAKTARWVGEQLAGLAAGKVRDLTRAWRRLKCAGAAAAVRDEQVTYFTNHAHRMAYDRYRGRGLDIGSGLVEGACKHLIAAREKGPGMRWSVPGAQAVANVRVLLFNDQWATYDLAA